MARVALGHGPLSLYNEDMTAELTKSLVKAQQEFAPLAKSATNPHFKNKFVPLHEVLAGVLPILNKNGLAITQFPATLANGEPALTTTLMHVSGENVSATMPLMVAKQDPQGQGSAITYARRYAIMSVLGVVGDEDDDGQAASKPAVKSGPQYNPNQSAAKKATSPSDAGPSPLELAKARLRVAIKDSGVDAGQFKWVAEEKSAKKITEAAQALEALSKGGVATGA